MITVPDSKRGMFTARVEQNIPLCEEHYRLVLKVKEFPPSCPGQFIELHTRTDVPEPAYRITEWELGTRPAQLGGEEFRVPAPLLRRPYSIAAHTVDGAVSTVEIIYRVIGKMTRSMEMLRPGDPVSVLGPLGRGFDISHGTPRVILAGGGVGIPPMLYLAERLAKANIPTMALVGVQRKDLLPLRVIDGGPSTLPVPKPCIEEFARHGIASIVTTDDGSLGVPGRIIAALDTVLMEHAEPGVVVCCCGPTRMMQATAACAEAHGVTCLASLEQPMACGMGTCQSCIVKFKPPGGTDWVYRLTCTDGPVFNTRDIIWN
ncbi:MAG: dihydroorotate dehydrogenase electron transfer subunit [Phycisphaerae bacterium]